MPTRGTEGDRSPTRCELGFVIVSERYRCIYSVVPKAACTNWTMLFRQLEGLPNAADPAPIHDHAANGLRYLSHDEAMSRLDLDRYFKFTVVRDPRSRFVSAFINKLDPSYAPLRPEWIEFAAIVLESLGVAGGVEDRTGALLSPAELLAFMDRFGTEWVGDHFELQSVITAIDRFPFDFVGQFEQLGSAFETVRNAVGFREGFPSRSDVRFAATGASERWAEYLSDSDVAAIGRRYAADFVAFGYSPHEVCRA